MTKNTIYKNSTLLITGGTGSFGNAVLKHFINSDLKEIRIFSRDEKKQEEMRKLFNSRKIKFHIGDVRDYQAVLNAVSGCDLIFHAAALKQVPSCEFYPLEAIKTNVLGTENVLEASIQNEVRKVVCLSTDKAVYPINAMGLSKGIMEKIALAKARNSKNTTITVTRYGNVMGSRGSVIPLFLNQISSNKPLTITDPKMTRFIMSLEEAVYLVKYAFENGNSGDIFVQKSPAINIQDLSNSLLAILQKTGYPIEIIGTRHGEKLYEVLVSREELYKSIELDNKYFCIKSDSRDLNYESYFDDGKIEITRTNEYNSDNTYQLKKEEMALKLLELDIVKKFINKIK